MIKASSHIFLSCLCVAFLASCQDNSNLSKKHEKQEVIQAKKEISYFNTLIDTTFNIESKDSSVRNIQNLYFEIDEENKDGIFTFRGGNQRNSPVRGEISFQPKKIK